MSCPECQLAVHDEQDGTVNHTAELARLGLILARRTLTLVNPWPWNVPYRRQLGRLRAFALHIVQVGDCPNYGDRP